MEVLGARAKAVLVQRQKAEIGLGFGAGLGRRIGDFRREFGQFGAHDIGAEEEIAGIPQIALLDIAFSGGEIGLFDKGLDLGDARLGGDDFAWPDIAIARRRAGRLDAERDDKALFGGVGRLAAQILESRDIAHGMVGGENRDHGLARPRAGQFAGDGHGGGGVAPLGLKHDLALDADLRHLFLRQEAVVMIGQDNGFAENFRIETQKRFLKSG